MVNAFVTVVLLAQILCLQGAELLVPVSVVRGGDNTTCPPSETLVSAREELNVLVSSC